MTYVVGFNKGGVSAIISDSRVTFVKPGVSNNFALKTGVLFKGCIFGCAGDAQTSSEFVRLVRSKTSLVANVSENWQQLKKLLKSYHFPKRNSRFQLVLSCRAFGEPQLFLLDSSEGLSKIPEKQSWVSVGSGKELLDPILSEHSEVSLPDKTAFIDYPHVLCLCLTTLSQSIEKKQLERIGVGGIFHFLFQTEEGEWLQRDSLYVIFSVDEKSRKIYLYGYRIAFVQYGLAVNYLLPPQQDRAFPEGRTDTVVMYDDAFAPINLRDMTSKEFEIWKQSVLQEINSQPYYYCLGYMSADPKYRNRFGLHFSDGKKYWIWKDGTIDPVFQSRLIEIAKSNSG